jgi:predicted transcriptional regulator
MKTLNQVTAELAAKNPELVKMIENDLAELRLAEELRRHRKKAGLTQRQVAERMHVNRAYVSQLEQGPQNVTLATLARYSRAVGRKLRVKV